MIQHKMSWLEFTLLKAKFLTSNNWLGTNHHHLIEWLEQTYNATVELPRHLNDTPLKGIYCILTFETEEDLTFFLLSIPS